MLRRPWRQLGLFASAARTAATATGAEAVRLRAILERVFDSVPPRLRRSRPVWVDLACVVDDAHSRPTRYDPRGWDMSAVVPGLELVRMPTAHGREVVLVVCKLVRGDGKPPGVQVTLLVPARAISPRQDQPARRNPDAPLW